MVIEIEEMSEYGYYLSIYYNGQWLHNADIDSLIKRYSDFPYEELALRFGAYIDHDSDVFFDDFKDVIRLRDYLTNLLS